MYKDYYIVYNPLTFNLMDLKGDNQMSPIHMISYLTNLNGFELRGDNYLDYLQLDLKKQRQGMVETLAMESYAALYVGNQISKFAPESRVIQADGKRRTIRETIVREGKKPKGAFITAMSSNFPTAVAVSIVLNYGKIPVIIGGLHASTSPDDTEIFVREYCPNPELIAQVIGAGDSRVIPQILRDMNNSALRPEYRGYDVIEDLVWVPRENVDYLPPLRMDRLYQV